MSTEVVGRVYAIRRADDFQFRYVGQTTRTLSERLRKHMATARSGRVTPFYSWLRKHAVEDIAIDEFEVIGTTRDDLGRAEQFWISFLADYGFPLLNLSRGGIGPSGVRWTVEQRQAASARALGRPGTSRFGSENPFFGRRHSDEQRAAWSRNRKGTNAGSGNPNFGKFGAEHPSFGSARPEETKRLLASQKLGALNPNFGKTASAETRAKRSAAQKGVPKPSSVRNAHTRYHTNMQVWKASCRHCAEAASPEGFTFKP